MPYIKIWIHLIWSTKNREPLLQKPVRSKVISHICENALAKGIHVDFSNGYVDHIHSLISLKANQSIAEVAHLLKGESSYWINKNSIVKPKFSWQDEYIAASISHSSVNKVRDYIRNQENHHKKVTFAEEFRLFMDRYGFELLK